MAFLSTSSHLSLPSATVPSRPRPPRRSPALHSFRSLRLSVSCRASQAVELFHAIDPQIIVRDAQLGDYWEVADTHCSTFFPRYFFPLDILLKVNRFMGLLSGSSAPPGFIRICLVAITDSILDNNIPFEAEKSNFDVFEGAFRFNKGSVAGILTLDNMGDFLPRRGPQRERRTGIAYISNVAVRKEQRRKGIAKMLVSEAVARASSWGCRAVALHCDASDVVATNLYVGQGFRTIKVPDGANWPVPRAYPGTQYRFMMKQCSSE